MGREEGARMGSALLVWARDVGFTWICLLLWGRLVVVNVGYQLR